MWWEENKRKLLLWAAILVALAAILLWGGRAYAPGSTTGAGESTAPASFSADIPSVPASSPKEKTQTPSSSPEPSPISEQAPTPEPGSGEPSASAGAEEPSVDNGPSCTISISCAAVLEHMDDLAEEKRSLIPQDGVILPPTIVSLEAGESAFDLLRRVCKERAIHMEFAETPAYQSAYIEGIQNLYELDCGALSGWMYQVNGWFPNYSGSQYTLEDGDVVCWMYTCDLGEDIGGQDASGQQGE